MKREITFERFMVLLGVAAFMFWWRPFVAQALWNTHAVAMGAPAVEFWWMFWALAVLGALTADIQAERGEHSIVGGLVYAALLFLLWAFMT